MKQFMAHGSRATVIAALVAVSAGCTTTATQAPAPAIANLQPASNSPVRGTIYFREDVSGVRLTGEIFGHTPGPKGFHIHEKGDCSAPDAMSAGGHFNPQKVKHGGPSAGHAGDLGNLSFDAKGYATVNVLASGLTVKSGEPNSVIGRALIVHMQSDDLMTDPTGNAGARAACGVIRAQ